MHFKEVANLVTEIPVVATYNVFRICEIVENDKFSELALTSSWTALV